jgi:hypothetical protein
LEHQSLSEVATDFYLRQRRTVDAKTDFEKNIKAPGFFPKTIFFLNLQKIVFRHP